MDVDIKLFELCKEVDNRFPQWAKQDKYFCQFQNDSSPEEQRHIVHFTIETRDEAAELAERSFIYQLETTPLYTSDFLLEKLKPYPRIQLNQMAGNRWMAERKWGIASKSGVVIEEEYSGPSDTPLEALLKLVIALNDIKEV